MLLEVSALCTMGMTQQLLPAITGILYFASPENKWVAALVPHFPQRTIIVDDANDNAGFYEGGALDQIHYGAWVEPLCWWMIFFLALYMAMVSTAVILRRQWMEHERLAYPLTQVGVAMIRGDFKTQGFVVGDIDPVGIRQPQGFAPIRSGNAQYPSELGFPTNRGPERALVDQFCADRLLVFYQYPGSSWDLDILFIIQV